MTDKVNKKVPGLVKTISIVYILGAILMLLVGILMIVSSSAIAPFLAAYAPNAAAFGGIVLIWGGGFAIAVAALGFAVGLGLWKGMRWARTTSLVLAVLGVISAFVGINADIISIVVHVTSLVVNGLIVWYLGFNKNVREVFS